MNYPYAGSAISDGRLLVKQMHGLDILTDLLVQGSNIHLVVRNQPWPRKSNNTPYASEIEALTIARAVHLNLMSFATINEALKFCPWLEVLLRRLWALLETEKLTAGPVPLLRDEAVLQVRFAHEIYPDQALVHSVLSKSCRKAVSTMSRAQSSMRNVTKTKQSQRKTPRVEKSKHDHKDKE